MGLLVWMEAESQEPEAEMKRARLELHIAGADGCMACMPSHPASDS